MNHGKVNLVSSFYQARCNPGSFAQRRPNSFFGKAPKTVGADVMKNFTRLTYHSIKTNISRLPPKNGPKAPRKKGMTSS